MNLQIVLNTQNNPYLNQAAQKILAKIFLPKQIPKAKKSFVHPHLARLIENPDSFADNLVAINFTLKFNNLAPFEETGFLTSWSKECHVMLGMNFPKLF